MIETVAALRIVRPEHTVTVQLPRPDVRQIDVPDFVRPFGQSDPLNFTCSGFIKKAEQNFFGIGGKQSEINPSAVPSRP